MNRQEGRIFGGYLGGKIIAERWRGKEREYLLNPNKCNECGHDLDWKHKNNKFCSSSCAAKFHNKNRIDKCPNKNGTKVIKCCECETTFIANIRSHSTKCLSCKEIKNIKVCQICGSRDCQKIGVCKFPKVILVGDFHKYFGFNIETLGNSKVFEEFERVKTKIEDLYLTYSLQDICNLIEYPKNVATLYSTLKRLGIQFRNLSDSTRKSIKDFKLGNVPISHPRYKTGWHETWEGKKIFYRSSYELEYAIQLDEQGISYETELLRVEYWDSQQLKYRIAIPDFYLLESKTIVEIKSDWTYNEQNMKDRVKKFKELGYNFKLILNKQEVQI